MVRGVLGVLLELRHPRDFLGFDFCPHPIIPVVWNPENPPPWGLSRGIGIRIIKPCNHIPILLSFTDLHCLIWSTYCSCLLAFELGKTELFKSFVIKINYIPYFFNLWMFWYTTEYNITNVEGATCSSI